jgi:hypothetical protein
MNAVNFVAARSRQLAEAVKDYLRGAIDAYTVQRLIDGLLLEAEQEDTLGLETVKEEDALWCLVWMAQHLCSESHPVVLAKVALQPVLNAVETGAPLPNGYTGKRPKGAA